MNTKDLLKLPAARLKHILRLKTEIEKLEAQVEEVILTALPGPLEKLARKKRTMTAAARKKISEKAKARWAKFRASRGK